MTPQEAREYLKQYLDTHDNEFPVIDQLAFRLQTPLIISEITFVGLLCIAYDLRPNEINQI
jgi:hypothetical protein